MSSSSSTASAGISFGTAFALVLSWTKWHSFWWAFLHGIFGWLYVIWYFLVKNY